MEERSELQSGVMLTAMMIDPLPSIIPFFSTPTYSFLAERQLNVMQGRHPLALPSPFKKTRAVDVFKHAQHRQQRTCSSRHLALNVLLIDDTEEQNIQSNTITFMAVLLGSLFQKTHLKLFHAPLWRNHCECISVNHLARSERAQRIAVIF